MHSEEQESFIAKNTDPLIQVLDKVIVFCIKFLATLMVLVILWGLLGVSIHIYENVLSTPFAIRNIDNLIHLLGSFLAVLIAIEIFLNIVFYLKQDAIHVPLVLGTALTAIARKVIILDYNSITYEYILSTGALILAVGIVYWLITKKAN